VNKARWHLPHTGSAASLAAGTRFTASQCGHTICSDSGCAFGIAHHDSPSIKLSMIIHAQKIAAPREASSRGAAGY
jgi:hypothetical protein